MTIRDINRVILGMLISTIVFSLVKVFVLDSRLDDFYKKGYRDGITDSLVETISAKNQYIKKDDMFDLGYHNCKFSIYENIEKLNE